MAIGIDRLGDSVGVEHESVTTAELSFIEVALPFVEEPEHCAGGVEPLQRAGCSQQESRVMSTVRVAKPLRAIVILGKEQSSVGTVDRALVKEAVDGFKKLPWLIGCSQVLAPEIGL